MISLEKVTVRHANGFEALREVSLRIPTGSLVYVVGRAGSGKSTLLELLSGDRVPTEGRVSMVGIDLAGLSSAEKALRRRRIGRLFRTARLHPDLTVAENVSLPLEIRGLPVRDRTARVMGALEAVGIADHATTRPGWLNRLEQQRVAVARAIAMEPDLVLADEPTALLDRESADELEGLIAQLATPARTVILATPEREAGPARRHARTVLLNKGFLIDDLGPAGQRATN
jgi:ABC-type ATPase involved in cell division